MVSTISVTLLCSPLQLWAHKFLFATWGVMGSSPSLGRNTVNHMEPGFIETSQNPQLAHRESKLQEKKIPDKRSNSDQFQREWASFSRHSGI